MKLLHLLRILVILITFSGTHNLYAQTFEPTNFVDLKITDPTNWTVYFEDNSIKIEYRLSDCDPEIGYDNQSILLRVENKTGQSVELKWHSNLYYDGECKTCDYEYEHISVFNLTANQIVEGDCSLYSDRYLKFFVRFNDADYQKGSVLTGFELGNLTIEQF